MEVVTKWSSCMGQGFEVWVSHWEIVKERANLSYHNCGTDMAGVQEHRLAGNAKGNEINTIPINMNPATEIAHI